MSFGDFLDHYGEYLRGERDFDDVRDVRIAIDEPPTVKRTHEFDANGLVKVMPACTCAECCILRGKQNRGEK